MFKVNNEDTRTMSIRKKMFLGKVDNDSFLRVSELELKLAKL